jgi:hypothetical protein
MVYISNTMIQVKQEKNTIVGEFYGTCYMLVWAGWVNPNVVDEPKSKSVYHVVSN